ncbi:MAG: hypothetical protein HY985_08090 [Magnetospirillum sp.]|nr:hypothetical protein [Magnetospirillum sp.]
MKTWMLAGAIAIAAAIALPAWAGDINRGSHLDNHGQSKVDNVKAKRWTMDGGQKKKSGYEQMNDQTVVNFGSKKAGTCNMNVGTTQPGQQAPKEVVVTAKDIINICK